MWLVAQATGNLADAITRDLFSDGRDFDELGWRGLWAYITTAPPNTAIHYARTEGWVIGDKLKAEQLTVDRQMLWRYTATHFVGGTDAPFPEDIDYPGRKGPEDAEIAKTWETATLDDIVSPRMRELLKEGA